MIGLSFIAWLCFHIPAPPPPSPGVQESIDWLYTGPVAPSLSMAPKNGHAVRIVDFEYAAGASTPSREWLIRVFEDGKEMITVDFDGNVSYKNGHTPDEAARAFWTELAKAYPSMCKPLPAMSPLGLGESRH